ncbi:hypothetical protein PQR75_46905 [Paraburkholderia fungorum]|uniref:hypothetical protein n=1 Tax=Paraburkholderia fungorum TaxID=134537 RepID=UPI0038BD3080
MNDDKPFHADNLTPEEMTEALRKIKWGSTDGGQTLPTRKVSTEPFDARTATPAERAAKAKELGIVHREH